MPRYVIKCSYEKFFIANLDVNLPDDEEELAAFMEEYEEENEVRWTEVKTVYEYSDGQDSSLT